MKFTGKITAVVLAGAMALSGMAYAAQTVYQTVSSVAGTELITLYGVTGPLNEYATANQIGATAFAQGSTQTVTASSGAATKAGSRVVVTSEALTTAAAADYVLTLTDTSISATSIVLASVANGTNTTEGLDVQRVQPSTNTAVIHVRNTNASDALNGTIKISVVVIN